MSASPFDKRDRDTLWETVYYPASETADNLLALKTWIKCSWEQVVL